MNRVIRAKALIALSGEQTVTLRTEKEIFEITPKLARKLVEKTRLSASNRSEALR